MKQKRQEVKKAVQAELVDSLGLRSNVLLVSPFLGGNLFWGVLRAEIYGYGSKSKSYGYAGVRLWLHLPRCHFGTIFLSHRQVKHRVVSSTWVSCFFSSEIGISFVLWFEREANRKADCISLGFSCHPEKTGWVDTITILYLLSSSTLGLANDFKGP